MECNKDKTIDWFQKYHIKGSDKIGVKFWMGVYNYSKGGDMKKKTAGMDTTYICHELASCRTEVPLSVTILEVERS